MLKEDYIILEDTSEKSFSDLVRMFLDYVMKIRLDRPDTKLTEIGTDFCFWFNVDEELLGEAISQDRTLTDLFKKELKIENKTSGLSDW